MNGDEQRQIQSRLLDKELDDDVLKSLKEIRSQIEAVEADARQTGAHVSVSAEAFLRLVHLKRPEMLEETVALDFKDDQDTALTLGEGMDDLDREWACGSSPKGLLNC
ncbi:hypothetical protein V8E52_001919 [Russula decolorans]